MVNTRRTNKWGFEMKYTWIDIDAPKQELHFKPVNESEETPAFKYRTGASTKDSLKP